MVEHDVQTWTASNIEKMEVKTCLRRSRVKSYKILKQDGYDLDWPMHH